MTAHAGPPRTIHVFIASPGDLAVERRAFKNVIDELNHGGGVSHEAEDFRLLRQYLVFDFAVLA